MSTTPNICKINKEVNRTMVTRGSPQYPPPLPVHRWGLDLHVAVCSVPSNVLSPSKSPEAPHSPLFLLSIDSVNKGG